MPGRLHPFCIRMENSAMHKAATFCLSAYLLWPVGQAALAEDVDVATAPPVVVKTVPAAGSTDVDPGLKEIRVTFSKQMSESGYSWTGGGDTFPETTGNPHFVDDGRTGVLPVKLEAGKTYVVGANSRSFRNFKDIDGRSAMPYLIVFRTADGEGESVDADADKPHTLQGILRIHPKFLYKHYLAMLDGAKCGLYDKAEPKTTQPALEDIEPGSLIRVRGSLGVYNHPGSTEDNLSPFPAGSIITMEVDEIEVQYVPDGHSNPPGEPIRSREE